MLLAIVTIAVSGGGEKPEGHPAGHPGPHEGMHQHRFEDAEAWAGRFEDPARDAWQKPDEVIAALKLAKTAKVADIGSATGYFPVRLARAVSKGRVWGVDIEPDMVRYLNARARKEKLGNLWSVLGTASDPLIPEPVDLVLMVDTYHHIGDRTAYLKTLKGYLAKGARLVIIDFKKGELPVGPPDAMKLAAAEVIAEVVPAGYRASGQLDFMPYQYGLVFTAE